MAVSLLALQAAGRAPGSNTGAFGAAAGQASTVYCQSNPIMPGYRVAVVAGALGAELFLFVPIASTQGRSEQGAGHGYYFGLILAGALSRAISPLGVPGMIRSCSWATC